MSWKGGIVLGSMLGEALFNNCLKTPQSFAALHDHSDRPEQVFKWVNNKRIEALKLLQSKDIPFLGGEAYFLSTKMATHDVLKQGILGIPASIFGQGPFPAQTIISVLNLT